MGMRWRSGVALLVVLSIAAVSCGGDSLSADAGSDYTISVGDEAEFDGCSSNGDVTQWEWIIREAPAQRNDAIDMMLNSSGGCNHVVDAMGVDDVGDWVIELIVTDNDGQTSSDTVTVTVEA